MSILNTQTLHARLAEVKARHPEPPWAERIAVTEYAVGVLICQAPGHPYDRHYHLRDEWWIVLEGESSTTRNGMRKPASSTAPSDSTLATRAALSASPL